MAEWVTPPTKFSLLCTKRHHAAARIVFSARKFDHVTPLLRELHWLWIPKRITFKLSCLVFWSLNGTAPVYLADSINRATDVTTRRSLRSSSSTAVVVPVTRCSTIEDRAFPVAADRAWNSLQRGQNKVREIKLRDKLREMRETSHVA